MTTNKLYANLKAAGVELSVEDGNLRVRAPKGALTDDLRQAIKAHKAALLERLRTDTSTQPAQTELDIDSPSKPQRKAEPIPDKDLSREELRVNIRELEHEINATPLAIDEFWSEVDLRIELRTLEAQHDFLARENTKRQASGKPPLDWHNLQHDNAFKRKRWVTLTAEEREYLAVKP